MTKLENFTNDLKALVREEIFSPYLLKDYSFSADQHEQIYQKIAHYLELAKNELMRESTKGDSK